MRVAYGPFPGCEDLRIEHARGQLAGEGFGWLLGSSDILHEARAACFPALRRPTQATAPIRQRFIPTLWVNRLPPRCKEHPDEGVSTLAILDSRLRLRRHNPNSLLDHEEELYRITDGLMERLTPLIGMAVQLSILDGPEALTHDVLHGTARCLNLPT